MKKWSLGLALLLALCLASGCGSTDAATTTVQSAPTPTGEESAAPALEQAVDIDLTALSSTMVYAEVYNMMLNPGDYVGKTVRVSGQCSPYFDPNTQLTYYYVLIADATACCQQGLEFVLEGEDAEYPPELAGIELTGTMETYEELGYTYLRIRTGAVSVLSAP